VHTLLAQFTDSHGVAKGKLVALAHLDDLLTLGTGFSGPLIGGTELPRIRTLPHKAQVPYAARP